MNSKICDVLTSSYKETYDYANKNAYEKCLKLLPAKNISQRS